MTTALLDVQNLDRRYGKVHAVRDLSFKMERGQIMGFDAKPGWAGWDAVQVQLPQSEMHDLVIELRSMTMGVGTFEWEFDHLQELMGKEADQVVAQRAQAAQ